ncbi:GntR family transcriptional regulator [Escherichia coli]|nr:GntR family transcriptional regulator [Escherichia coli]
MPEFSINMTTDLLKDVIYRRIRDMIINGTLPMGCKISESALATRLSSTKAPVRDALRRLQSEGLVHIRPKSGTFVFNLSDIEFNGLLEFRYFVEAKALRLSLHRNQRQLVQALSSYLDHMTFCLENNSTHEYIRLDNLFHEALFTYCGNAYLQQSYVLISAQMATIRNYLGSNDEHMHRSHQQHVAIIQAIQDADAEKAFQALQEHILPEKGAYWGQFG